MVKQTSVILYQQIEFVGDSEDDVEVVGGQEFALPGRQPAFTSLGLALRAVPVATRIVGDRLISALGTSIEVTPECCRAAVLKEPA